MRIKLRWDIEKKILAPFLLMTIIATLAFGGILYYSSYHFKIAAEQEAAASLLHYLQLEMDDQYRRQGLTGLYEEYAGFQQEGVYLYDADGSPVGHGVNPPKNLRLIQESRNNLAGWSARYYIDQTRFTVGLIEEQRYTILATIALMLIIVQSSIMITDNIATPLRRLNSACKAVSERPEGTPELNLEFASRRDEIGDLAKSFDRMLNNIHSYNASIVRVKLLNETIVESLPIAVVAYGRERQVLLINSAAKKLLARTDYRYEGQTLAELLQQYITAPKLFYDPLQLVNGEQKTLEIELGIWRLTDENQLPWGVLCTLDDVTYKKILEARAHQDDKLVYAGKLAANLAHEIRNPLAGIRASVQVVGKRLDRETDRQLCQSIIGEVDRINLLVENLVDLSRRREVKKDLIDIPGFYEELLLLYAKVAENSHIQMRAEAGPEARLYADASALKQIFINLINNSIKAIQSGGHIVLKAWQDGQQLHLTVEDDGLGMPEQKLALLQKSSEGGGGLGLPIVEQLLQQNGGSLAWQSEPGQGTRIVMTFQR